MCIRDRFNALGDSIILLTYFKTYKTEVVYYNRAEFTTLTTLAELFGVTLPKFIQTPERIEYDMTDVLVSLTKDKAPLISMEGHTPSDYETIQLGSSKQASCDRNITMEEALPFLQTENIKDAEKETTLEGLVKLLKGSCNHVSMDSGTAWLSSALNVPTSVVSKNSYYWHEAYYYMRYLQIQNSVNSITPAIKIATEQEYSKAIKDNKVAAPYNYQTYKALTNKI